MIALFETKLFRSGLVRIVWLNIVIALALGFVFWTLQSNSSQHTILDEIISSLIHAAIYGSFFGFTMPYLGDRLSSIRRPWNWISIVAAVMLITVVATLLIEFSLFALGYLRGESFWQEYLFKSVSVFFIALVICLSVNLYEIYHENIQTANLRVRTNELEKERALKLATEARIASLESRLHPHFLFNTLNSISALIAEDPAVADKMVQRLASVLRSSLDASRQTSTSVEDEIRLVCDYLEIEKVRFRDRLRYAIEVGPELMSLQVPPMILQPIVENSVKFAVSPNPGGAEIRITGEVRGDELIFTVWDDGPGFTVEMIPSGHGLDSLRQRLDALFGDNALLAVNAQDGGTAVSATIKLNEPRERE